MSDNNRKEVRMPSIPGYIKLNLFHKVFSVYAKDSFGPLSLKFMLEQLPPC